MLGQGADTQLDRFQRVEVLDQFVGRDADETRRQSALRRKHLVRTLGEFPYRFRHGHILGQVEVMQPVFACNARDRDIAEIRQAGNNRLGLVSLDVRGESGLVGGVEIESLEIVEAMGLGDPGSRAGL